MFASERLARSRSGPSRAAILRAATGVGLAFALMSPVCAQQTREQEQIRRLRQQVQQLQQEQAAHQQSLQAARADNADLQKQLAALGRDLGRARAAAGTLTARAGEAEERAESLRGEREQLQARAAELAAELERRGQTIEALRVDLATARRTIGFRETALANLNARHQVQAEGLQICIARNDALRDVGLELLDRWANKGVADVFAAREPFFQIRRVELENLVQGYRETLDRQALRGAAASGPGGATEAAQRGESRAP